ncbi:MAG: Bug family tripartite tricarboxylate transporter substrate binding protein, partial [Burkholderiales bacterium]
SATDQIARVVGQQLQESLGQPFVVENKPGAQGSIASAEVARAAPDGYTLLMTTNTPQAANVSLFKKLNYDPVKDFAPIARLGTISFMIMVRPDFPAKNFKEFLAHAKANPGKLTAAQASAGMRVSIAMLRSLAGVEVLEVPYKGQPQALQDVLGGQVSLTFADYAVGFPQIKAGKIRGLGVTTPKRSPVAPDIPTLGEGIPGFDVTVWAGMAAPAGTPREVVDALWHAAERALANPDVHQALQAIGFGVEPLDPQAFTAYISAETVRWAKMVKEAGIEPE